LNQKERLNKNLIYLIFLFIGLNIQIFRGFYVYNFLVLTFLLLNYSQIRFSKINIFYFSLLSLSINLSILVQILYIESYGLDNFFIFLNMLILLTFIAFVENIKYKTLNFSMILVFLLIPIMISIFMFHFTGLEQFFLSFYNVEKFPSFGRYGGVFGRDVNALGIYASLMILVIIIFKKYKKITNMLALLAISLSFYAILLSGMRTGILVLFGLLIFFNYKLKLLNYKYIFIIISIFILFVLFIYSYDKMIQSLIDFMLTRFSVLHLIQDFTSKDAGNLHTALEYFYKTLGNREINTLTLIFGIDSSLGFVDNFYIFSFLKYGFIFILALILVVAILFIKSIKEKEVFDIFMIVFTLIIAIKGIFVMNNFYMIVVLFLIFFWRENENISRC